jgi:hypothetical protein
MRRSLVFFLALLLVALVALAALLAGCGSGGSSSDGKGENAGSTGGPVGQAEAATCSANRRTISSAAKQYEALEGKSPTSIQQMVPKYLKSVPVCPSGGSYSLSGDAVTCSVHGN